MTGVQTCALPICNTVQSSGKPIISRSNLVRVLTSSELEWHELKNEKPRIWGRYLVYFPANDKTNNGDYIDLCYWNGEIFLGGVTRGVYIGLEITHWMPLPEMPKG